MLEKVALIFDDMNDRNIDATTYAECIDNRNMSSVVSSRQRQKQMPDQSHRTSPKFIVRREFLQNPRRLHAAPL